MLYFKIFEKKLTFCIINASSRGVSAGHTRGPCESLILSPSPFPPSIWPLRLRLNGAHLIMLINLFLSFFISYPPFFPSFSFPFLFWYPFCDPGGPGPPNPQNTLLPSIQTDTISRNNRHDLDQSR